MGIARRHKRHGIGSRLVNQLTERFIENGVRIMLVDTDANNTEALQFFQKSGFGNDLLHVYLSRNLESHPKYIERRDRREPLE